MGLILLIVLILLLFGGLPNWGLSLVWLRSLGHHRDDINYRPVSVRVGPNLRVRSGVRPAVDTYIHAATNPYQGVTSMP
jgi:hypothetical protein